MAGVRQIAIKNGHRANTITMASCLGSIGSGRQQLNGFLLISPRIRSSLPAAAVRVPWEELGRRDICSPDTSEGHLTMDKGSVHRLPIDQLNKLAMGERQLQ